MHQLNPVIYSISFNSWVHDINVCTFITLNIDFLSFVGSVIFFLASVISEHAQLSNSNFKKKFHIFYEIQNISKFTYLIKDATQTFV